MKIKKGLLTQNIYIIFFVAKIRTENKHNRLLFKIALVIITLLITTIFTQQSSFASDLYTQAELNNTFEQSITEQAIPDEWQEIIDEAPMTSDEFSNLSFFDYIKSFIDEIIQSFKEPLRLFASLCAVIILVSAVKSMSPSSLKCDTSNLIDLIAALTIFTICSSDILELTGIVQDSLNSGATYMSAFIPVFATILVSCGQASTSLVYSGMFFVVTTIFTQFFAGVILPITRVMLAMYATSAIDATIDLSRLAGFASKCIKWTLTLMSTMFATVLGLQTALAYNVDNAAIKAGKFILGSSIPVVGRAVSDAVGGVLAGMKVIKGSVGFAAVAAISALVLPIVIKCICYYIVFILGGYVASSTGNTRTEKILYGCATCIGIFIFVTLLFCAMIITVTIMMIVVGTGG